MELAIEHGIVRSRRRRNIASTTQEVSMKRFAVAILAVLTHASAYAQDMYDFRGLRLGASLSEIRKVPYPDVARWPDVKLICTGDKERAQVSSGGSTPDENLLKIGVVVCGYYRSTNRNFSPWGLDFIGVTRMQALLFFTPAGFPEEQRSRLYMISLEAPTERFDATAAALKNTYGEPGYSKPEKRLSEGKTYDNLRLGWQASGGMLITERYFHDIKTMYVTYQHQRLSDAVDRAEQKLPK
jgi:hypothetical protein